MKNLLKKTLVISSLAFIATSCIEARTFDIDLAVNNNSLEEKQADYYGTKGRAVLFERNLKMIKQVATRETFRQVSCNFTQSLVPKSLPLSYFDLSKEEQLKEVVYQYYAEHCSDNMDEIANIDFKALAKLTIKLSGV